MKQDSSRSVIDRVVGWLRGFVAAGRGSGRDRAGAAADDTSRGADLRPGGTEGYQGRDIPLQQNQVAYGEASTEQFTEDSVTVGDVDTNDTIERANVEPASEGYGDTTDTGLSNTSDRGTSTLTGSTYTETDVTVPPSGSGGQGQQGSGSGGAGKGGDLHVVERYNYGMGDLGVGAGTTPEDAWSDEPETDETTVADVTGGQSAGGQQGGGGSQGGDSGSGGQQASAGSGGGQAAASVAGAGTGTSPTAAGDTDTRSGGGTDAGGGNAAGGVTDTYVETPTDETAASTTEDINATVSPYATREEVESQSRGDAVNRSDVATQTPGFGAPETFGEADTGTTEPSRSATGDELDHEQDALGTTLEYGEATSDAFDEDAANLSAEEELGISDTDLDYGPEGGAGVERVATFQSGTIAHEGLVGEDTDEVDPEVTAEAYADLRDEPRHETSDDTGLDDFSGSDYPSDRRVDVLAGDDFTEAEVPDVADLDSSAGDLYKESTDAAGQVDFISEPVEHTIGDAGSRVDQDIVGTTDEHIGGEEPDIQDTRSMDVDEPGAHSLTGMGTTGAADTPSGATVGENAPAGAVRGDGGTEAPEGYPIKGNGSSMIYHLPDFPSYAGTKAEYYFATEADALNAGYRAPGNVRRETSGDTGDTGNGNDRAAGGRGERKSDDVSLASGDDGIPTKRPRNDAEVASETPTGVVTEAPTSGTRTTESEVEPTYPEASETSEATGSLSGTGGASDDSDVPAGAVRGDGGTETPPGYPVKGNANSMIYHLPGYPSYKNTKAEFCFATEEDAINAGYRAPGKRNRGKKS